MAKEFVCNIDEKFGDFIIEERGNSSINVRKVAWGEGSAYKLDIRKWLYLEDGTERASKGVTLTDEGADELTGVLAEQGYGDTKRVLKALSKRDDFDNAYNTMNDAEEGIIDEGSDDYYDPKELLG